MHVASDFYSLDIWKGSILMPWCFGSLTESLGMHDRQPEQRTRNIHLILPEN